MLFSHRLTHHRISALIALFAIALLFIAPDISKVLEQQRMSAYGGMRMGMSEMVMSANEHQAQANPLISADQAHHHAATQVRLSTSSPLPAAADMPHPAAALQRPAEPAMAHKHAPPDSHTANAATLADVTVSSQHASHAHPADASSHSAGKMAMDEFSCGYCELLVHLPMLVWIFIPLLWLLLLAVRILPPAGLPVFPLCWFPGTCQPRAPPQH